jgi:YidC/Oxa1 family membrane protein insertase
MDRNSVIGLLLIGGILLGFSIFNAPSDEEIKQTAQTEIVDSLKEVVVKGVDTIVETPKSQIETSAVPTHLVPKTDAAGMVMMDSLNNIIYVDPVTGLDTIIPAVKENTSASLPEKLFTLENDVLKLEVSSKGGYVKNAWIKDYKDYQTYVNEGDDYLKLFDEQSKYGVSIAIGGKTINTTDYDFKVVSESATALTIQADIAGKTVDFVYALTEGSHDLSHVIKFNGFEGASPGQTTLLTDIKLLSTEKYLLTEQRNATVYYDEEGSYDYLSAMGDDELVFEERTNWIAFKQLFFSAIVMKKDGFGVGSEIAVSNRPEMIQPI